MFQITAETCRAFTFAEVLIHGGYERRNQSLELRMRRPRR